MEYGVYCHYYFYYCDGLLWSDESDGELWLNESCLSRGRVIHLIHVRFLFPSVLFSCFYSKFVCLFTSTWALKLQTDTDVGCLFSVI
jgi:hypothetical protein